MYATILCLLTAVVIYLFAPTDEAAAWTPLGAAVVIAAPLLVWLALRVRFRLLMVSALHSPTRAERLRPRFTHIVQTYQAFLLAPFALYAYATDYPSLVVAPVARVSEAAGSLLGIAPYIGFWFLLWREAYPLQGFLFGRGVSRAAFVKAHARMELPMAAPWLVVLLLGDLLRWLWPEAGQTLAANPSLDLLYTPVFLLLAGIFAPVLVKTLWGCRPVPPGPLRDRLARLAAVTNVRVREILFWPLLEGRVLTAGIVGLLPRWRYLLITPSLAEALSPEELDGVVAHEAGHIRHRHLWFYLLFFSGVLVCGLGLFLQLASAALLWWDSAFPETLRSGGSARTTASLLLTGGVVLVLFLGLRVFFGHISRAFERQADLNALEALGDPGPIISALEAISRHSGNIRDLPSWHHGSVGERVAFLADASQDPSLARDHHLLVRRIKVFAGLGVLALAVFLGWLTYPSNSRALEQAARKGGLERRVAMRPDDLAAWVSLGALRFEAGEEAQALAAFRSALARDPGNPEAENGAAWVLATAKNPKLRSPGEALMLAKRAAAAKPFPHILDTLAEAYFAAGDPASALALSERVLAAAPPGDPALPHYERQRQRFLEALGR